METPKQNRANKIGRKGVAILNSIIEIDLDWNFRINHQEDDFGIDAYIDLISDKGNLTGKSIAMQIKSGDSYFKHKTDFGWKFYGELKHLNYYLNQEIPVILVLVDTKLKKAFWTVCDPTQTEGTKNGWTITVPFDSEMNAASKSELKKYISPTVDYVSQLEDYWEMNRLLKSFDKILIITYKEDILNSNYQPVVNALKRITNNKELLFHHKENVEIAIHGYDDDSRELYEIHEVRTWVRNILDNVDGLAFFLHKGNLAQFIKLILFCQVDFKIIEGAEYYDRGILRKKVEFESEEMVVVLQQMFQDLNEFCDLHKIPENIGIELSRSIADCFSGGEFSKHNKA